MTEQDSNTATPNVGSGSDPHTSPAGECYSKDNCYSTSNRYYSSNRYFASNSDLLPHEVTDQAKSRSAPLTDEEMEKAYFEMRNGGVDPTARLLLKSVGRGSLSTWQKIVTRLDNIHTDNVLTELEKRQIPDAVMKGLLEELTRRACKFRIEYYDNQIVELKKLLIDNQKSYHAEAERLAAELDAAQAELQRYTAELQALHEQLLSKDEQITQQTNQLCQLSNELQSERERRKALEAFANLIRILQQSPKTVDEVAALLDAGTSNGKSAKGKTSSAGKANGSSVKELIKEK